MRYGVRSCSLKYFQNDVRICCSLCYINPLYLALSYFFIFTLLNLYLHLFKKNFFYNRLLFFVKNYEVTYHLL